MALEVDLFHGFVRGCRGGAAVPGRSGTCARAHTACWDVAAWGVWDEAPPVLGCMKIAAERRRADVLGGVEWRRRCC
jgi:hypothetical protein